MHLLSTRQLHTYWDLEKIFDITRRMEYPQNHKLDLSRQASGKVMAIIKDEPSTRTRLSFEVAMKRLGGEIVLLELNKDTSLSKGETIEDTYRTVSKFVDVIVMRCGEQGMVQKCANLSNIPLINAGDGDGEHPTQALLDMYTIRQMYNKDHFLNVLLVGDLKYSRTVHSLIHLLGLRGKCKLFLVSPEKFELSPDYYEEMAKAQIENYTTNDLLDAIRKANGGDVLYMTRMQLERHLAPGVEIMRKSWYSPEEKAEMLKHRAPFILDEKVLSLLSARCIMLHPLPRREEFPEDLDRNPGALHWRQVKNGMYVRMALLYNLFNHGAFFPIFHS